jgi:hypothetical protein
MTGMTFLMIVFGSMTALGVAGGRLESRRTPRRPRTTPNA